MHEHHCTGSQLPGPAVVIVGDMIKERLDQARSFGCATIDLTRRGELPDMIKQIVGEPVVDAVLGLFFPVLAPWDICSQNRRVAPVQSLSSPILPS